MTKQLTTALLLLLMITPCLTWAQKKELNQARSYIKSGKENELRNAEQLMKGLLKDQKNKDNKKIYATWFEAVQGLYRAANERMYLKQKQDTAQFFDLNKQMFTILEKLDSVEMRPNAKGRIDIEYRKKNSEMLNSYRPNIFNAGVYYVRKGEWQKAFDYFEFYIDCAQQPLFSEFRYDSLDTRMPEAAYWATYSGYRMEDAVLTLRHHKLARRDTSKISFTLQYIAQARLWLNDQELYLKTLEEGFRQNPTFSYFFPRLIDAYSSKGQYDKALAAADTAIAICDTCTLYMFAKSTILFRLEQYGKSIKVSERIIALNPNLAEAYFNAGTGYLNIALRLDERRDKKQLRQLYQKARPYMEKYRKLMPKEKDKWGPALYRIYLNLNMGKQFDEIDRLLK